MRRVTQRRRQEHRIEREVAALALVIDTGLTLKLVLVRVGIPLTLSVTLPVKPPEGVTVRV